MFIGLKDKNIEFARTKGAKDKKKRNQRRLLLGGIAGGVAVVGGAALLRKRAQRLGAAAKLDATKLNAAAKRDKLRKGLGAPLKVDRNPTYKVEAEPMKQLRKKGEMVKEVGFQTDQKGQLRLFETKEFQGKTSPKPSIVEKVETRFKDKQGELLRLKSKENPSAGFVNRKNFSGNTKKRKKK